MVGRHFDNNPSGENKAARFGGVVADGAHDRAEGAMPEVVASSPVGCTHDGARECLANDHRRVIAERFTCPACPMFAAQLRDRVGLAAGKRGEFVLNRSGSNGLLGGSGTEAFELWDDVDAQRVAQERDITIGLIFSPHPARTLADALTLGMANSAGTPVDGAEHGADDLNGGLSGPTEATHAGDAPKATRAGTAKQGHEHGFKLVIGMMSGGHERAPVGKGQRA